MSEEMNCYQATYRCTCTDRTCTVSISAEKKPVPNTPPPACLYGKNVGHILSSPPWELKGQRLKGEEAQI
jgi:hypothetical protein